MDRSYYEGHWKNNKMEGLGFYEVDTNLYEGYFQNSIKNGFGI